MTYRRILALLAVLCLAGLTALAAPNFSGTWKLNIAKSDFGQMPAPNSMTRTITHEEPKLKVATKQSSDMGDFESEANYTTDGKECTNTMRDTPMKSVLKWEGDALVINTKGSFGGNEVTITAKWTLSSDGKVLTVEQKFSSSMGEGVSKQVFEKQ